jgi:hypothetical protein
MGWAATRIRLLEKCPDRLPFAADLVHAIMRTGHRPGQGPATWVQAVNDLPKAQASRWDEFAGAARGSGHRAQSPRCPVVGTFAPAGRLHVGRSFTACAITVIAAARLSMRFVHRRSGATANQIEFGRLWVALAHQLEEAENLVSIHDDH